MGTRLLSILLALGIETWLIQLLWCYLLKYMHLSNFNLRVSLANQEPVFVHTEPYSAP